MDLFDIAVASKLAGGGGGGASNVVYGEFETGTTGTYIQEVEIPYTGSGFPIAAMIWIKGGVVSALGTTGADNTLVWNMVKINENAPTWTSSEDDKATVSAIYKYSGSASQVVSNKSYEIFKSSNPSTGSQTEAVSFAENNKIKVCQNTGSGKFLNRGKTYQYAIIYSS